QRVEVRCTRLWRGVDVTRRAGTREDLLAVRGRLRGRKRRGQTEQCTAEQRERVQGRTVVRVAWRDFIARRHRNFPPGNVFMLLAANPGGNSARRGDCNGAISAPLRVAAAALRPR